MQVDIAEVYSPARVTKEARKFGLKPGEAMDLTTGWDFRKVGDREKAERYVDEAKPRILIGSPMCTAFSTLQNLSPWTQNKMDKWIEAREHIKFVVKLYRKQIEGGRMFLHEHPARATSWALEEIQKLAEEKGVVIATADQCMYGLTTWGEKKGQRVAAMKPTKFMTNAVEVAK
eukprot:2393230-Karenia_brevis.AAC.1